MPHVMICWRCCLLSRWKLRNLLPGLVSSQVSPPISAICAHSSGLTLTDRPMPSSEPSRLSFTFMLPTCQSFLNDLNAKPAAFFAHATLALPLISWTKDVFGSTPKIEETFFAQLGSPLA